MAATIARTLGVKEAGGETFAELLKEHQRAKRRLLVLDNFEQVLDAASLAIELLTAVPQVSFLVTSRERLHLRARESLP